MVQSLELDDDDAGEALQALERSLGFQFDAADLAECRTVGDLHRLVAPHMAAASGEGCAGAMAYYRLRRALMPHAGGTRLRPSYVLSEFIATPPRQLFRRIERETRLQLPPLASGWLGLVSFAIGVVALLAVLPVHIFYPGRTLYLLLLVPAAIWLFTLDPGRFGKDCRTLGDLARKVAILNYAHLIEGGARPTPADQWEVVTEVLAGYSAVPKRQIRADMLILPAARYAAWDIAGFR